MGNINIEKLKDSDKIPFTLLQSADPSIDRITEYLNSGQCYVARLNTQIIGVLVLKELSQDVIEIKNISIDQPYQGKGYGRLLLQHADRICRESKYDRVIIGTGNSSIGQLALYQKEGFEVSSIKKNFFVNNYDELIFENGIQCKHMIMLEKKLNVAVR